MKNRKSLIDTKKKKRKLSIRWIFQRIEIFTTRIKYKRKAILIKIFSMIALAFGFIGFNCNLDKIKPLKNINSLFQIKAINELLGISLNLFFIVIYVFSFAIYVAIAKVMSQPITYIEDNEIAEMTFNPTTNDEVKSIIAPEAIVSYPNPKDKNVTIKRFFLNSTTEEDWKNKKETLQSYYGEYIKGIRPIGSTKIEIALTQNDPNYPKPIYWDDNLLNTDKKNCIVVVGQDGFCEPVTINLTTVPHYKIGASSRGRKNDTPKTYKLSANTEGSSVTYCRFQRCGL